MINLLRICVKNIIAKEDKLLQPIDSIKTNMGGVYTKFTMYYNKSVKTPVLKPSGLSKRIRFNQNPIAPNRYSIKL